MEILIFDTDKWDIEIKPELLLIKPFRQIFDKYEDKQLAMEEMTYVYFMADYKSDFNDIYDKQEKSDKILESLTNSDKLIIDEVTERAIDWYIDVNDTVAIGLLKDMQTSLGKIRAYLRDVDLFEETNNGNLKYDIKKLVDTYKSAPGILKSLRELEEEIVKESQTGSARVKGSQSKGLYED